MSNQPSSKKTKKTWKYKYSNMAAKALLGQDRTPPEWAAWIALGWRMLPAHNGPNGEPIPSGFVWMDPNHQIVGVVTAELIAPPEATIAA